MTVRRFRSLAGSIAAIVTLAAPPAVVFAQEEGAGEVERQVRDVETIRIIGTRQDARSEAGSAFVLDEEILERYEYDDIHRVVNLVPGVYFREEDGFGLRPNIGIRGASSERSAKVTLMEDGVLIAPAPYSAPAAYFFPLTTRMVGVEVFKGPASIPYGPNTIGGAINLVSRPVPERPRAMLDASYGSFDTYKVHAAAGTRWDLGGFLLEGVRLASDGFKDIDNVASDTGFERNELVFKGAIDGPADWALDLGTELKLAYSDEVSNETYLGLADEDFRDDPYRRYAGSQQDRMEWDWYGIELRQRIGITDDVELTLTGYRHDFERAWEKLNRFRGGPPLEDILADPSGGQNAVYYAVLTGELDSGSADETLLVGTNDREFVSQGVQALARGRLDTELLDTSVSHALELGVRLHDDEIVRFHTEDGFVMRDGLLEAEGSETGITRDETGSALAWAFHVLDQIGVGDLSVTPGVRVEVIETVLRDRLTGTRSENSDVAVLPGIGAYYQLTSGLGVLAGVHRGFSPVAPGQPDEVEPEESLNYEVGARAWGDFGRVDGSLELIGFWNDYDNLIGQCTFSAGCDESDVDRQFNGGEVDIRGLEALLDLRIDVGAGLIVPLRAAYTLTDTEFQSSFVSETPLFGEVEKGDELPYVPEHQLALSLGIQGEAWGLEGTYSFRSAMRDVPGQGPVSAAERTDDVNVVDLRAHWRPFRDRLAIVEGLELYVGADNLFDEEYIASRRPFGARPGKPFSVFGGIEIALGG